MQRLESRAQDLQLPRQLSTPDPSLLRDLVCCSSEFLLVTHRRPDSVQSTLLSVSIPMKTWTGREIGYIKLGWVSLQGNPNIASSAF